MGNLRFTVFDWDEDELCWRVHCEITAISYSAATEHLRLGGREGTYIVLSNTLLAPFKLVRDVSLVPLKFGNWAH